MKARSQAYLWAQTELLERSELQAKRWIRLRSAGHMRTTNVGACVTDVFSESDLSTGKERDTESGNDYFGARYYASTMGRWLSPDLVKIIGKRLVDRKRSKIPSGSTVAKR